MFSKVTWEASRDRNNALHIYLSVCTEQSEGCFLQLPLSCLLKHKAIKIILDLGKERAYSFIGWRTTAFRCPALDHGETLECKGTSDMLPSLL